MKWHILLYVLFMLLIVVSFKRALIESGIIGRVIIMSMIIGLILLMYLDHMRS